MGETVVKFTLYQKPIYQKKKNAFYFYIKKPYSDWLEPGKIYKITVEGPIEKPPDDK